MRLGVLLCAAACAAIACRSERKAPRALDPETAPPAAPVAPAPTPAEPSAVAPSTPARALPIDMDVSDSQTSAVGGPLVTLDLEGAAGRYVFTVMSRGTSCVSEDGQKDPILALKIDDAESHRWSVNGTRFVERSSKPIDLPGGRHHVSVDFLNDHYAGDNCDRNAWVSHLRIAPEK